MASKHITCALYYYSSEKCEWTPLRGCGLELLSAAHLEPHLSWACHSPSE